MFVSSNKPCVGSVQKWQIALVAIPRQYMSYKRPAQQG